MPRRKKARYGREMRARAADLFEAGLGFELAAKKLDVPAPAVRKWLYAYRATGRKGLIGMGESRRTYDMETKLAVARAVVDEGMPRSEAMARFGIAAATSLDRWCRLYREGGPEALEPGTPVPCAAVPAPLQLHDGLARLHVPLPSGLPARRISACGQKRKALALRRLALCSLKRRAEARGVRGCSRQPPPIGAECGFARGSVSALDAAQLRRNTWEWDGWEVKES